MEELPVRKPNRFIGYNYSSAGHYFITICTKDKINILGDLVGQNASVGAAHPGGPQINLTEVGQMVRVFIKKISISYQNVSVDQYTIMPNHIHLILVVAGGTPGCASPTKSTVAKVVNALKALTSKQFGQTLWQRSYHDHIIRNEDEYRRIYDYIDTNPMKWMDDIYFIK